MESKTSIASAANPAGPVTSTCNPGGVPSTTSRTPSTSLVTMSPSPVVSSGTVLRAVVPSREKAGRGGGGGRPAVSICASSLRCRTIRARSACVRPPSRRYTTTAAKRSPEGNSSIRSITSTDSAPLGR